MKSIVKLFYYLSSGGWEQSVVITIKRDLIPAKGKRSFNDCNRLLFYTYGTTQENHLFWFGRRAQISGNDFL